MTSWPSSFLTVTKVWFIWMRCFWMDYILAVIFPCCYQSLVYPSEVFLNGLHLGCHRSLRLPKSGLSKWVVKGLELGCHPFLPQCDTVLGRQKMAMPCYCLSRCFLIDGRRWHKGRGGVLCWWCAVDMDDWCVFCFWRVCHNVSSGEVPPSPEGQHAVCCRQGTSLCRGWCPRVL